MVSDDDVEDEEKHLSNEEQSNSHEFDEHGDSYNSDEKSVVAASASKKREPSEEGEIDDLEEGELRSESDSDNDHSENTNKVH